MKFECSNHHNGHKLSHLGVVPQIHVQDSMLSTRCGAPLSCTSYGVCNTFETALRSTQAFVVDKAQDLPSTRGPYDCVCLLPVMQDVWPLPIAGVSRAQYDIV